MKIDKFKEFISNRFPNLTILFDLDDIKCRDMISFKCSKHGNKVSRYDHLIKYGCKDCNRDNYSKNQFDTFVNKSNDVHHNKYDYSKSNYINNKTPITIVCTKHGSFKEQILKDQIKKDFCSKNKIKFIIIKFNDNIIDILDSIFKKK